MASGFAGYIIILCDPIHDLWDSEELKIKGHRRSERSKCFKEVKIGIERLPVHII